MDNVGDWLYIVFLIIAGITSVLGSKDKKKAKKRPEILGQPEENAMPSDQPSNEKGFWEILEDMQKEVQKPMPQPRSQKKKKVKVKPQIVEEAPSTPSSPFLTTENQIPDFIASHSPERIQPLEDEPGLISEDTFKDMGELRRAIICSEILNRKY